MTEVEAPLRRRWGVTPDSPCEPFAFEGSFDGVAQAVDHNPSSLWSSSSWFAGAVPATHATSQRCGEAVPTLPTSCKDTPGGAASQNRLTGSVATSLRQPFAPTSSARTLSESVMASARDDVPMFDVTTGRLGAPSAMFAGRGQRLVPTASRDDGWTYSHEAGAWVSATGARLLYQAPLTPPPPDTAACHGAPRQACGDHEMDAHQCAVDDIARAARLARFNMVAAAPERMHEEDSVQQPLQQQAHVRSRRRTSSWRHDGTVVQEEPPYSSAMSPCVWTPFRLRCGTIIYLDAGDVTPEMAAAWCEGTQPWPLMCSLSLDAGPRMQGHLPRHMPGPELHDGMMLAQAKLEIRAWVVERLAEEQVNAITAPVVDEDEVCVLRRQLDAARAWAARLENALHAAGVALPSDN